MFMFSVDGYYTIGTTILKLKFSIVVFCLLPGSSCLVFSVLSFYMYIVV